MRDLSDQGVTLVVGKRENACSNLSRLMPKKQPTAARQDLVYMFPNGQKKDSLPCAPFMRDSRLTAWPFMQFISCQLKKVGSYLIICSATARYLERACHAIIASGAAPSETSKIVSTDSTTLAHSAADSAAADPAFADSTFGQCRAFRIAW